MSVLSPTPDNALREKISGYIEAAYLHGLPTENMDTGELEPPADIADVAWITDSILRLMASEVAEKSRLGKIKEFEDMLDFFLNGDGRTPIKTYIEDRLASLTKPNDNERKG